MEGGNPNDPPQDRLNPSDQQEEGARENKDSAKGVPDERDEAAGSSSFLSDSQLSRLLQEGECEFEIPEAHETDDDEEVDLVIDGDRYRELLALHGEEGMEAALKEILEQRRAALGK